MIVLAGAAIDLLVQVGEVPVQVHVVRVVPPDEVVVVALNYNIYK